jgi:hypothetical protein
VPGNCPDRRTNRQSITFKCMIKHFHFVFHARLCDNFVWYMILSIIYKWYIVVYKCMMLCFNTLKDM